MYKIEGAHLQCVNNYYAKSEYKRMKTVGVTDYTNPTPTYSFRMEKCLSSTPIRTLSNLHRMAGAHHQCVNNHYVKFKDKKNENCWGTIHKPETI